MIRTLLKKQEALVILTSFILCLTLSACVYDNETVVETSPPYQEYTMVLTSTPAPEAEESNEDLTEVENDVPEFIFID